MHRLPHIEGEWLDRSRSVTVSFEGQTVRALAGDTISSALAANGIKITARSFKYHRPRSLYSAAGHDANNLFQVGDEPNQRGDQIQVSEGQQITAVNTFGGVAADKARVVSLLGRFLPVGFYYKAFRGKYSFPLFERLIRYLSGLGRIDVSLKPARRTRVHEFCEVAVVGSGIAGLSAALQAVADGAQRVVLIDENAHPGGSGLWLRQAEPERSELTRTLLDQVAAQPRIRVLSYHCVVGLYADNELALSRIDKAEGGLILLRAQAIVLATGAIEQPPVFRNNDLPGILLASGALRLYYRYAIAAGDNIVVLGANSDAVQTALDLAAQGLKVSTLALLAGSPLSAADLPLDAIKAAGLQLLTDVVPVEALAGSDGCLQALSLRTAAGPVHLNCDALLLSAGWMPALQLALQGGATLRHDDGLQQHVPATLPHGVFVAGRANGQYSITGKAADGRCAGAAAAAYASGQAAASLPQVPAHSGPARSHNYPLYPHPKGKEFVDLDEDLTLDDLVHAAQEGFDSIELLKRYSTVGMGPSQGKLSNLNAARLLGSLVNQPLHHVGLTTARPPYQPLSIGSLAGTGFTPLRRTAFDAWHEAAGVVWMPAGQWRRPAYYAVAGRSAAQCVAAEVQAVRSKAGIINVSTLGKIDLHGPDAATLLERLYTGRFADMKPGSTRYAVMVDEAGTIIDDGVVARYDSAHFYVSTTTSASAAVYREMQRRVAEWQLDCILHNLTGHLAALNLAGPQCRSILSACTDLPLTPEQFPYLAARQCHIAGVPARVARVGFVGELGYEIHIPTDQALTVWDALHRAAGEHGLQPFGVEAQRQLRLEKGHIIVSQDTDGLSNPYEASMGWSVKSDKPFFVGQRSLQILKARGPRQLLVGFELTQAQAPVSECHLIIADGDIAGRITSIGSSATLGKTIGLAMVKPALAAAGTRLHIRGEDGAEHAAVVVSTPFYDPANSRQKDKAS